MLGRIRTIRHLLHPMSNPRSYSANCWRTPKNSAKSMDFGECNSLPRGKITQRQQDELEASSKSQCQVQGQVPRRFVWHPQPSNLTSHWPRTTETVQTPEAHALTANGNTKGRGRMWNTCVSRSAVDTLLLARTAIPWLNLRKRSRRSAGVIVLPPFMRMRRR